MRFPLKSKVAFEEGLQMTPKECDGSYLKYDFIIVGGGDQSSRSACPVA